MEKSSTQQPSGVFYQLLVFVFIFIFVLVFILFIFILFSSSTNTFTIAPCSAEIGVSIVRHMGNVSYITLMGQAILALAVRPECAGSPAKGLYDVNGKSFSDFIFLITFPIYHCVLFNPFCYLIILYIIILGVCLNTRRQAFDRNRNNLYTPLH